MTTTALAHVSPMALATLPREHRALVVHYLKHCAPETVGLAVKSALLEPGGAGECLAVWEARLRGWVQIYRTMYAPGEPPPCGPSWGRENVDDVQEVLCEICGARWRVNLNQPETPIAIGRCPVVGPVTWAPKAEAMKLRTEHGRDIAGWVKCWVHGQDGWDG